MIVIGLARDAHAATSLRGALQDDGFALDEVEPGQLETRGVPRHEADVYAEGVRRGGALVVVRAQDEAHAQRAAQTMAAHGAVDIEQCASGWQKQPGVAEEYTLVFGEYPAAPGRIYGRP